MLLKAWADLRSAPPGPGGAAGATGAERGQGQVEEACGGNGEALMGTASGTLPGNCGGRLLLRACDLVYSVTGSQKAQAGPGDSSPLCTVTAAGIARVMISNDLADCPPKPLPLFR